MQAVTICDFSLFDPIILSNDLDFVLSLAEISEIKAYIIAGGRLFDPRQGQCAFRVVTRGCIFLSLFFIASKMSLGESSRWLLGKNIVRSTSKKRIPGKNG